MAFERFVCLFVLLMDKHLCISTWTTSDPSEPEEVFFTIPIAFIVRCDSFFLYDACKGVVIGNMVGAPWDGGPLAV